MQYEWMHCLVQSCVCAPACTRTSTTFDWISQRKTSTLSAPPHPPPLTVLLIRNSSISSLHPHLFSAQFSGWQIWSLPLYLFFKNPYFWTTCPSLLTISRHLRTYQLIFLSHCRSAQVSIHPPFHCDSCHLWLHFVRCTFVNSSSVLPGIWNRDRSVSATFQEGYLLTGKPEMMTLLLTLTDRMGTTNHIMDCDAQWTLK